MGRVNHISFLGTDELVGAIDEILDNRASLIDNGIALTDEDGGVSVDFYFGLPAETHVAYANELHKIIRPEVVSELRKYSECRYRPNAKRERALIYLSNATRAEWLQGG